MILDDLKQKRLYFDGGTGSVLQAQGLQPGHAPEEWSISHPERITALHAAYLDAGADIIKTNTFGVNPLKYDDYSAYVRAALACAHDAVDAAGHGYIALDIGPLGRMLAPLGDLPFEDAVAAFAAVVREGVKYAPDLILIETMNDSYEAKAALLAAKENSDLPVFVTCVYDESGKLMTGADPLAMIALLEGMGADAIGINCSLGPDAMLPIVKTYARYASVPVIVNPNAGLPSVRDGVTVYDVDEQAFAAAMEQIACAGGCVLGGCCGTTPAYIAALRARTQTLEYSCPAPKGETLVSSYTHAVCFDGDPVLIGERINPTGKKAVKQALTARDYSYILGEGIRQADAGVQMLDCNAGVPGIDEPTVLCEVVSLLQTVTDLPLQIDSTDPNAIERSARVYNGKPLINSVNGSEQSMSTILPIVKKYGGAVIALTMDEDGIPETADGRVEIACRIIARAAEYGIDKKNIIADPLALTISAGQQSAAVTLEAVDRITHELGIATSLGVSNISFGLPARDRINAAFFTMALTRGLGAAIVNPFSDPLMDAYRAYRALAAYDRECMDYIAASTGAQESAPAPAAGGTMTLYETIVRGLSDAAEAAAREQLCTRDPLDLINEEVVPALNEVGVAFEEKRAFLPQLLMSADAASRAFGAIKEKIPATQGEGKRVVLATVKGDIHDIGKNIVGALLANFGFTVVDLGRDVPPERVVEAAQGCRLVGLSALMTTTVPAMEETIRLLHAAYPEVRVVVGGAVLTQEYADSIGADFYAKDAMQTVRYAQRLFE